MGIKCLIVYMDVAPTFASISFPFLERCQKFLYHSDFFSCFLFGFFFLRVDTLQILNYEDVSVMDECRYPYHAGNAMEIICT